jgi:hypothetical protein
MRKKMTQAGFSTPRLLVAACLFFGGLGLTVLSFGSNPSNGTLTNSSGPITYTAGPFTTPNLSPVGAGQLDTGPRCGTTGFDCDNFDLSLQLPAGYTNTHPYAAIKVTMSWVDGGTGKSDYDLYVYKGQVPTTDGSMPADYQSASGNDPEVASIAVTPDLADGNAHHFSIKIVPYTPTGETLTVKVEFLPGQTTAGGGAGFPNFGDTDPTVPGNPRFLNFYAPDGTSAQPASGEFNIGFNPHTGRIMLMNVGPIWRITPPELFSPAKPECCEGLWEDKDNATTNTGLDPILWTDQKSGRTFASNSTVGANVVYGYSDNDGDSWIPIGGALPNAGADHETIGTGPYPAALSALGVDAINHGEAVYYCSQDIVGPAACYRSDTLGASYGPSTLAYNGLGSGVPGGTDCGGLHGHLHVAPDGTVWLPVNQCAGFQGGVFSADGGTTWHEFKAPNATSQQQGADPSIAIDADSTIYYSYVKNEPVAPGNPLEGHAHVATGKLVTTTDPLTHLSTYSINWIHDVDVGRAAANGDKGIVNAAEIEAAGGSSGRAAVGFLGTDIPGDYQAINFAGKWYAFISTTYDGGATWTTVNATPNDPVQSQTGVWQQGGGAQQRNLLDFNEITIDDKGNVLYGYSDGCTSAGCINGGPNDFTAFMRVARQSGGRSLFASHDSATDLPGAPRQPKAPCLSGARDSSGAHLTWKVPDNGGAGITSYVILRSTAAGNEQQIATFSVGPDTKPEYTDTTTDPNASDYFYKVQAVNSVSSGTLSNEVDLPITVPPLPQSPCQAPGVTVLTDATGDSTIPVPGYDLLSASVAQPYAASGNFKLVFTVKTDAALAAVQPAGSAWYLAMTVPEAGGTTRYTGVRMEGTGTGVAFYSYVPGANTSGAVDGRFVDSKTAADPSSSYNPATGTITIVVSPADLGLAAGSTITGFVAGSSQTTDPTEMVAGATEVWDSMPNSLSFTNTFSIQPNGLCAPLQSVVSRKTHGAAGNFDIPLPLTGTPGLETRGTGPANNVYTLVYTLGGVPSSTGTASVTQGTASTATAATGPGPNQLTVTLSGVPSAQHLMVNLGGVQIVNGGTLADLTVPMDVLVGDVNQSRRTDSGDQTVVRNASVSIPTSANFRLDVNASGRIDSGDQTVVRNCSVTALPLAPQSTRPSKKSIKPVIIYTRPEN